MNKKRSSRQSAFFNIRILISLVFCLFGIVLSLFAAGVVPSLSGGSGQSQPNQSSRALTKSLTIAAKGITLRYPEGWSVGQPTLNSWVIVNAPAGRRETVKPTVRVVIGYLERTDHAGRVCEGIHSAFNFPRRRWLASLAARSARQETSTRQRPSFSGS